MLNIMYNFYYKTKSDQMFKFYGIPIKSLIRLI